MIRAIIATDTKRPLYIYVNEVKMSLLPSVRMAAQNNKEYYLPTICGIAFLIKKTL
jgi:hypothetical protein